MPMRVTSFYHRTNPDEAGYSLANFAEVWGPCFDAIGAKSIVEVGAERGRLTQALLEWAAPRGARVTAIEPKPLDDLIELTEEHSGLEVVEEISLEALAHVPIPDVVVLDGDHNYYTLSEELRLLASRAADGRLPFLLFHDLGWPLARRDQYHAPELIPEEHRNPYGGDIRVTPGDPGVVERGLPFEWAALSEGGAGNGILTAVEDFLKEHGGLRLAIIPIFFGCGLMWPADAAWSDAVEEIVRPWDRNPVLERLERARVAQLVQRHAREQEIDDRIEEYERLEDHCRRLEEAVRPVVNSRALPAAELLSRLRRGGRPAFSREELRRLLEEGRD